MGAPMLLGALMRPGFAGNRTLTLPLFEEVPERLPLRIQHSCGSPAKEKPPARGAQGTEISLRPMEDSAVANAGCYLERE